MSFNSFQLVLLDLTFFCFWLIYTASIWHIYILTHYTMKTTTAQFKHCHATVATFTVAGTPKGKNFVIFYSYACPKLVIFPDGAIYRFSFENSRKAGEKTSSVSTSRQCNAWLWYDHKTLNEYNLGAFERKYFDTRLENYF